MSLDFGKKLRTIEPHFEKHGSYKKKECIADSIWEPYDNGWQEK